MDLVNACRVFVHVGEHGSFTLGAAAARVPQSVASRRVAALEEHLGRPLFDRSARRTVLTAFGQEMLPSAKRLVQLAEALELHAQEAKLLPVSVAVPETCGLARLAQLDAAAREAGIILDVRQAGPGVRAELLASRQVRAALLAVPAESATWRVPLGLARAGASGQPAAAHSAARPTAAQSAAPPDAAQPSATLPAPASGTPLHLDSLRPTRSRRTFRRVWIQPEDDVPHVRDPLQHAGHRAALLPAQIVVAASLVAAAGETLRSSDYLLCSARQADDLGLHWRPLASPAAARGYDVSAVTGEDAARIREVLGAHLADALGTQT